MRPHLAGKFAELDFFVVDRVAGSVLLVRSMALTVMAVAHGLRCWICPLCAVHGPVCDGSCPQPACSGETGA